MRIVFLGTPAFAAASLQAMLDAGFNVVAVITAPDKPAGRGRQLQVSAVKELAVERGLPVLQPVNLKDQFFLDELRKYEPDLGIVVAFRMLPESVWNLPPLGTYNLHASLLPKYRGAAPINWAIIKGEKKTGVTIFKLKHEIDSGNIFQQKEVIIDDEMTAGILHDKLRDEGAKLLVNSIRMLEEYKHRGEEPPFQTQDETEVTHAPKIFRDDCRLNWSWSAGDLHNKVRGLSPIPGAFTMLRVSGKSMMLKILRTRILEEVSEHTNGSLIAAGDGTLTVKCGKGSLQLLEVQLEGRRRMEAGEFCRGFRQGELEGVE